MKSKYEEFCELTCKLDVMIADGADESDAGETLRDQMDDAWWKLTEEEQERFRNDPVFCPVVGPTGQPFLHGAKMKLWIVGKFEKVGWGFVGVFDSVEKADAACLSEDHLIFATELNYAFPDHEITAKLDWSPRRGDQPVPFDKTVIEALPE